MRYRTGRDHFYAGPGVAVPASIESRIEFQRAGNELGWNRHLRGQT
jgi:hypothetical protein